MSTNKETANDRETSSEEVVSSESNYTEVTKNVEKTQIQEHGYIEKIKAAIIKACKAIKQSTINVYNSIKKFFKKKKKDVVVEEEMLKTEGERKIENE